MKIKINHTTLPDPKKNIKMKKSMTETNCLLLPFTFICPFLVLSICDSCTTVARIRFGRVGWWLILFVMHVQQLLQLDMAEFDGLCPVSCGLLITFSFAGKEGQGLKQLLREFHLSILKLRAVITLFPYLLECLLDC